MDEKINKLPTDFYIAKEKQHKYKITVQDLDTGDVLYVNESYAGVMCTAEEVKAFGMEIETNHQHMEWGNVMIQMHLMNMLNANMQKRLPELFNELERLGYMKEGEIAALRMKYSHSFRKGINNEQE